MMTNLSRTIVVLAGLSLAAIQGPARAADPADTSAPAIPAVEIGNPSLLEIRLNGPEDRERLLSLSLDVVFERPGISAHLLGWPGTEERLRAAGFSPSIVHEDYGRALAEANDYVPFQAAPGRPAGPTSIPPQGSGSLGGYYTLAEIEQFLTDLSTNDSKGIVGSIETIGLSRQGRPIHALRISRETFPEGSRPRVLFTALTHARESIGMQSVIEFMTRLVDGYGVDPNLTYLVNRREIWFVPCVNPDGYTINQNSWFNSGSFGMWRKNARDNDTNGVLNHHDGVDINRNFNYKWGVNNAGSSPDPDDDNYRGTSAWSEPETRALRDFAIARRFSTATHYHTFGELCLYPWGYNSTECPDGDFYRRLSEDLTKDLAYEYGVSATFLYQVNGGADDWFYGEQAAKPKCYAVTAEVGDRNDGFWPPASRIPELAAGQFHYNVTLAYAAGVYVLPETATLVSPDGFLHPGGAAEVSLTLRHAGVLPTGYPVTASVVSLTPGVTVTDPVSSFPAMSPGANALPNASDLIGITASSSLTPGTVIDLLVTLTTDGSYFYQEKVQVLAGVPVIAFSDDASAGIANWAGSNWGTEISNGDPAFSDSPGQLHTTLADARLTKSAPVDLSGAAHAYLTFNTWYDIEVGADAGRVEVSTDGGTVWTPIPGLHTRPGHGMTGMYALGTQVEGEPVYNATQKYELPERMDLTPYAGLTDVRIRFRFTADETNRRDGWYVDDIRILVFPDATSAVPEQPEVAVRPVLSPAAPNPFRGGTRLTATFARPTVFSAAVYAVDGRLVRSLADGIAAEGDRDLYWDGLTDDGRPAASGSYFIRVAANGAVETQRVVRVR